MANGEKNGTWKVIATIILSVLIPLLALAAGLGVTRYKASQNCEEIREMKPRLRQVESAIVEQRVLLKRIDKRLERGHP